MVQLFPIRDWSYYLLAMVYAAIGLWIAWRLFERYLDPGKRIVALACLTLVPYFNFHGLRFDHNAVLGPLWAATTLCFIRSFETRSAPGPRSPAPPRRPRCSANIGRSSCSAV